MDMWTIPQPQMELLELENCSIGNAGTFLTINPNHIVSVFCGGDLGQCGVLTVCGVAYIVKGTQQDITKKWKDSLA